MRRKEQGTEWQGLVNLKCISGVHLLQLDGEEHGHDGDHVGGVADEPVGPVEDPAGARLRMGPGAG